MKNTVWILAILLLLSLFGNWFQFDRAKDKELIAAAQKVQYQDLVNRVAGIMDRVGKAQGEIDSIASQRVLDSLRFKSAQSALKIEIQGHKKTIARLRPLVQHVITANPALDSLVTAQDSVILNQDSTILSLSAENQAQFASLNEVIRLQGAQIADYVNIAESWEAQFHTSEAAHLKVERALKHKVMFWKITTAFASAAVLYMIVKP